jgi:enoyl-CoA hydratase
MQATSDLVKTMRNEAGILHINLSRSQQLNALNHALLEQLATIFHHAKQDPHTKAILLTGEGKAFCAGADINELAALNGVSGMTFAQFGQKVFRDLELLGKPSLAAIQGFALGGGCELAMSATLRVATVDAFFSQPEIKLGVIPGFGGTQRLARLVGKGRALELCLTGRRFSAQEAHQWGFLNEVVAAENLLSRSEALLKELASFSAVALKSIIAVIHQGYDLTLEEGLELEAAHFGICCTTADKQEGVSAFLEKRVAQFWGE